MIELVTRLLHLLGFNRAISYGLLNRSWGLVASPVTMLIIACRLTKEQQGFYYTIGSLLAMQVFFELGLTSVISQFASHEFASLSWKENGAIEGDPVALARFEDLLCKSTKWFGAAALILVSVLVPSGLAFFGRDQPGPQDFAWRLPWLLAVLGTALNLFATPFFALITGSGDVATTSHRYMVGAIVGSCISWLVMGLHGGLYAVSAVTSGNIVVSWLYLFRQKPELLRLAWKGLKADRTKTAKVAAIDWMGEIWPMQWKIAISWIAGYFVFQLFNPVLFHFHGPVIAGQMGMTMGASNALLAGSLTWLMASSPEFGKLAARRAWSEFDSLFRRILVQSLAVVTFGACAGWALIRMLQAYSPIGQRFIPSAHAALLFAAVSVQVVISGLAIYLRAHKQEPLFAVSVVAAIVQAGAMVLLGEKYASLGVTFSYLGVNLFLVLPSACFIWHRCRMKWHAPHEKLVPLYD
ncbi:MAG: hypothetical protein NDI77_02515 [Geobacteraceae bacterium]|nr:hypothetical protein [Geobacteraceae bacterium]